MYYMCTWFIHSTHTHTHTHHHRQLQQKSYHVHLLQEVLLSRQVLLQKALFAGSPDAAVLPERRGRGRGRGEMEGGAGRLGRRSGLDRRAQDKYRQ